MQDKEMHKRVPITEETRKTLRAKRLGLGFSYSAAAEYIGVHWSTCRKWETGETTQYTRAVEHRVQYFLNEEKPSIAAIDEQERATRLMEKLISRFRYTYRLCRNQPRLQERLNARLETLIDEVLNICSQSL